MLECWSHFKKRLAGLLHPDWCWTELYTYYHTAVALNVGSQFLWRTKWKTQQPLCLNCDDEDCQWVVCNHSIAEFDTLFLLSTCSRDALSLYILVVLDQIKRKIDCNHCLTMHWNFKFYFVFPRHYRCCRVYVWGVYSRQLCSNASLSLTEAHAAEELNDYCSLESPTQTCHSGCPDVPVCCYLLTPFL